MDDLSICRSDKQHKPHAVSNPLSAEQEEEAAARERGSAISPDKRCHTHDPTPPRMTEWRNEPCCWQQPNLAEDAK